MVILHDFTTKQSFHGLICLSVLERQGAWGMSTHKRNKRPDYLQTRMYNCLYETYFFGAVCGLFYCCVSIRGSIALNRGIFREWCFVKKKKKQRRKWRDFIYVQSSYLPGGTEVNHEHPTDSRSLGEDSDWDLPHASQTKRHTLCPLDGS